LTNFADFDEKLPSKHFALVSDNISRIGQEKTPVYLDFDKAQS
jgi:hypothetical protein